MKEKFELNPRPANIVGHCKVEYKDPITDKVLEKIEGNNHVFIDQFYVQDLRSLLSCDLILADGTDALDTSLPMIPGKPVGYGKINSTATGVFQGAYRSTDSYIYRMDSEKIESNYVYDYLSSQIPGSIKYVGLVPTWGQYYKSFITNNINSEAVSSSINNIDENCNYTILFNGNTLTHISSFPTSIDIKISSTMSGQPTITKSIYSLISPDIEGPSSTFDNDGKSYSVKEISYSFAMAYDKNNENFIIRCSHIKMGDYNNRTAYCGKCIVYYWRLNKNLDSVISRTEFLQYYPNLTNSSVSTYHALDVFQDHGANTDYMACASNDYNYGTSLGFIDNNNNYCIFTFLQADGYRSDYLFLIRQNMETGTIQREQLPYPMTNNNYKTVVSQTLNLYENYVWLSRRWTQTSFSQGNQQWHLQQSYTTDTFYMSPVYNIENNSIYCYNFYFNGRMYYANPTARIKKGIGTSFPNSWVIVHDVDHLDQNTFPFALTAYRLPLDAPSRPEGAAVSVTYNLQIFY